MALHLHRAERTDLLADGLGALLANPLPDPFAEELVLVPARGVERWLSQRLSHVLGAGRGGDGVCAGVSFRSPGSLIAEITGTVDDDPWSPDAMTWPLLEVDRRLARSTVVRHPGNGTWATSTPATKPSCAEAGGIRWRDDWPGCSPPTPGSVRNCSSTGSTATPQGLDTDLHWQPELWRALVERVDADPPHIRHQKTARPAAAKDRATCRQRLSLFGHTRLACTDIELLQALSTHHDLHLWLPHPSDDAVAEARRRSRRHPPSRRHQPSRGRTIRCWPRSDAISANCNAACPPIRRPTNTCRTTDRARHPARLAAVRHRRQCRSATRPHARDG